MQYLSVMLDQKLNDTGRQSIVEKIKNIKGVFNAAARLPHDKDPKYRNLYSVHVDKTRKAKDVIAEIEAIKGVEWVEMPPQRHLV